MALKVAVASWDGEHITQHFGRAEQFIIYEIEGDTYHSIETRFNNPGCNSRQHDENLLSQSVELLADCAFVLVSRIGPGAQALLSSRGIRVIEAPIFIDQALERLINSKYFKNLATREKDNGKEN
ncbi:NifB/NifX family molybdenum-iron cluster-binding protein [Candidatus Chlorohelix sp.]|uniref:NifB/NifX family molybdenum-iron cluster-binding protein n=1 Tax=Candidatus Chlorohelix sp. TaxID=3139201 RepID=UPI0018325316|nr:dinitrogenase iron-molybdenum cofactor biosynthesis protein [Chloroflexota bacterium]